MKKGDVLCHTLAGNSDVMKVVDEDGKIKQCVLDARERGVIFDLSHGTNAYSYDTAEAAWKAGFFTDTISTDLHGGNINGPVFNMGVLRRQGGKRRKSCPYGSKIRAWRGGLTDGNRSGDAPHLAAALWRVRPSRMQNESSYQDLGPRYRRP